MPLLRIERTARATGTATSLTEARAHLRLDFPDDDPKLDALLRAAELELERLGSLAVVPQTIVVTAPRWPGGDSDEMGLPIGPVLEGASVAVTVEGESFDAFELEEGERPVLRLTRDPTEDEYWSRWRFVYAAGWAIGTAPRDLRVAVCEAAGWLFDGLGHDHRAPAQAPALSRAAARYRGVRA